MAQGPRPGAAAANRLLEYVIIGPDARARLWPVCSPTNLKSIVSDHRLYNGPPPERGRAQGSGQVARASACAWCSRRRVCAQRARRWRGWVQARGGMLGNKVGRVGAAGRCSCAGGRGWVHLRCVRPGVVAADCITYNGPPPARPGGLPVMWPWTVTGNSGPLARRPDSDRVARPGRSGRQCVVFNQTLAILVASLTGEPGVWAIGQARKCLAACRPTKP